MKYNLDDLIELYNALLPYLSLININLDEYDKEDIQRHVNLINMNVEDLKTTKHIILDFLMFLEGQIS